MRKFRGLNKDGKWVEGWYCKVEGKSYIIPDDSKMVQVDYTLVLGVVGFVAVDHKTVGQYTGLKDVNGKKELYFDDIVIHDLYPREAGVIKWNKQDLAIKVFFPLTRHWSFIRQDGLLTEAENIKHTGNIHENPKLLETKNE